MRVGDGGLFPHRGAIPPSIRERPVRHSEPPQAPGQPPRASSDIESARWTGSAPVFPATNGIPYNHSREVSETMARFNGFMYVLVTISVLCMVLSWFTLSGTGGFCVSFVLLVCLASFLYCSYLVQWILVKDTGQEDMRAISDAIKEGAEGFLVTQYSTIFAISLVVAVILFFIYEFRPTPKGVVSVSTHTISILTAFSFILGALCSGLAGYVGVWTSVRVNIRVAAAAARHSYSDALRLSFRGGAVSSVLSASMCILGLSFLYVITHMILISWSSESIPPQQVAMLLSGYGFGASFVALFMQLGGGIYTKAADVGADMVGKIERDIPEDDPRNPAVIADLVGDNVGDCAGSMADVFESIAAEIIGTMILGGTLARDSGFTSIDGFVFFPLVIHALDLIISGYGIILVKSSNDKEDPLVSMKNSYGICMILAAISFTITTRLMLYTPLAPSAWWYYDLCGLVGVGCSYLLVVCHFQCFSFSFS